MSEKTVSCITIHESTIANGSSEVDVLMKGSKPVPRGIKRTGRQTSRNGRGSRCVAKIDDEIDGDGLFSGGPFPNDGFQFHFICYGAMFVVNGNREREWLDTAEFTQVAECVRCL